MAGSFSPTATGNPTPALTAGWRSASWRTFTGGSIAGTPSQSGTFPIVFTAANGVGPPTTQAFTLTVGQAPVITSAPEITFVEGTSCSFTPTASGYPTPIISEDGKLSTEVTYTSAGLSGAATQSGTFLITFTAHNGVGTPDAQSFKLTVLPFGMTTLPPRGSVYSKTNKVKYSATLTASGGNPPYKWSLVSGSSLPPGLKLSSKGVISGKATRPGPTRSPCRSSTRRPRPLRICRTWRRRRCRSRSSSGQDGTSASVIHPLLPSRSDPVADPEPGGGPCDWSVHEIAGDEDCGRPRGHHIVPGTRHRCRRVSCGGHGVKRHEHHSRRSWSSGHSVRGRHCNRDVPTDRNIRLHQWRV